MVKIIFFLAEACALLALFPLSAPALPSVFPPLEQNAVRLGVIGFHYINGSSQAHPNQRNGLMGVNLAYNGFYSGDSFLSGINAEGFLGNSNNARYLNINELYIATNSRWQLILGRKLEDWSSMDAYWSMGLFQPRFRWDYLNEKQNGLSGAFLHFQSESNTQELTAYASPIFIPELNAPFAISNGTCQTNSAWFNCPGSTVILLNQPTTLNLTLHMPRVMDVVLHPGAAIAYRLGNNKNGPWARAAYAYKPMNQIVLAYVGKLNLSTLTLPADIYTRVLYQQLYAFDAGWASEHTSLTGSAIIEHPKADTPPADWNIQNLSDARVFGAQFRQDLYGEGKGATRLELANYYRIGGNEPDKGLLAIANSSIFESRYNYKNAYSVCLAGPLAEAWKDFFQSSIKFIVDKKHDGNILATDLFFEPTTKLTLNLGVDLLGSNAEDNTDFISRYQHNGRLRGGLYYVF